MPSSTTSRTPLLPYLDSDGLDHLAASPRRKKPGDPWLQFAYRFLGCWPAFRLGIEPDQWGTAEFECLSEAPPVGDQDIAPPSISLTSARKFCAANMEEARL